MNMNSFHRSLTGLLLLIASACVLILAGPRTNSKTPASAPSDAEGTRHAAGLKVHLDPATGRIVPPPANPPPDVAVPQQFRSSLEGLVEERGTTAAGGFKVDARGRFRSAITVRLGPDGKTVVNCIEPPAPATR
jgi:hypothetical protein